MKTIVVAQIGGKLVSLPLSDLGVPPARGVVYVFGGQRYRVGEVLEYLGSHDLNGKPVSSNEKLLAILESVFGPGKANLNNLTSIGSDAPKNNVSKGGIIVPNQQAPVLAFDNAIYLTWDTNVVRAVSIPAHSIASQSVPLQAPGSGDGEDPVAAAQVSGYCGA